MRTCNTGSLNRGGSLGTAAQVDAAQPELKQQPGGRLNAFADDFAAWREQPGKVTLRARPGEWSQLLAEEAHVLAGDCNGAAVAGLPPRPRSARGALLRRMQAMVSPLALSPNRVRHQAGHMTYVVNADLEMSSGKTLAQVAHAAVMAADSGGFEDWVAAGCPANVVCPGSARFASLCRSGKLAARVVDAGLTEVPSGIVTVLAIAPGFRIGVEM